MFLSMRGIVYLVVLLHKLNWLHTQAYQRCFISFDHKVAD